MSIRVASVTVGTCFFDFARFLLYTGPGFAQDRIEDPELDFRLYLNSLSCEVVTLVDMQSCDLIELSASGWTFSHCERWQNASFWRVKFP